MASSRDSRLGDEDTVPNVGRNRSNGDEPRHEPFSLDRPRGHQDQNRLNHDQDQATPIDCSPPDLFPGVLASHWLWRACDAHPWLIGQRKHSMPFFGAGLRSEAMEAPPTSVLGTHVREEGRW